MEEITVLVPGFTDDERILHLLERKLRRQQLNVYTMAPQPSNGEVTLETLAAQLAEWIEATFDRGQPLNLFGFSMGGLVCRVYVQWLGGLARTRRLVTLATPHRGTYFAYLLDRPGCHQMRPGSAFLSALNADLTALEQVCFTSIWTPFDLTILPATSSLLPVGKMVAIYSPFHRTLPWDPQVVQAIASALRKPLRGLDESWTTVYSAPLR
jgi:triacylglycerol lipase